MIRQSNHRRDELIRQIAEAVPLSQEAVDQVDEAAGRMLGLNRTDLRCLGALARAPMAPSRLAEAVGLSRGATTTVIDRLAAAGYVRRVRDLEDRRGVRVELTAGARKQVQRIYGPIVQDGTRLLAGYSTAELGAVLRFLTDNRRLQQTNAERIRSLAAQSGTRRAR